MKFSLTLLLWMLAIPIVSAQVTQNLKGTVVDQNSEMPLVGATVQIIDADRNIGEITNANGQFIIRDLPVGRYTLYVAYLGYESLSIPNVEVNAGKETSLPIALRESYNSIEEVVVTSKVEKDKPVNEMAGISVRQFSLEEVNRYAGGRLDVARLASNFAGVSTPDDSRNDIVIRGNSPTGVLWQIEGIPVPSPNHYSTTGTTGGPVSALNTNMLKSSDFLTSAFPAQYGNATAGVFDIGFRNGNSDRLEYTLQVGVFSGVEAMAEGPVGKNGGAFLVSGRYSFVGLVGAGAGGGSSATPDYADLSFKVNFGNGKAGQFSLFGVGGRSDITFLHDEIDEDDLFAENDADSYVTSGFGVVGLKHNILFGNSYIRTIIGGSIRSNEFDQDRYFNLDQPGEQKVKFTDADQRENRFTFTSFLNSKLNRRQTIRVGVLAERTNVDLFWIDRDEQPDLDEDGLPDFFTLQDIKGNQWLVQPYAQTNFRLTEALTLNAGLHGQYASLNEQFVVEPRAAFNYSINERHVVSLGYGMHHQTVPLPILMLNENVDGVLLNTNESLKFIRSQHLVLGWDTKIAKDWRLKSELYYQFLDRVPVEPFPTSYSVLTEGAGFVFATDKTSLVNEGSGFNRGIELTLEKFYSNDCHLLLTASLFESRYEGSDGVERSTPFDNRYVVNLLGGKEFKIGKNKSNAFTIDTRLAFSGGRKYTPVDLEASRLVGFEITKDDIAFSEQYADYIRWDLRFGFKLNSRKKKLFHQFYFDFQNVTNRENVFVRRYNRLTNNVDQVNQVGFFPDFMYRIQF